MSSEELKKLIAEVRTYPDTLAADLPDMMVVGQILADECERLAALSPCADELWQKIVAAESRAESAEDVLRSLASWLGNGGYMAETVDAAHFEAKIRDGVERVTRIGEELREKAEAEVKAVIDHMPKECVVQCREGGGPENIYGTLAISASKMASRIAELQGEIERLQPLQYAVGNCGASEVPEVVFAAWKDSAAYRNSELHRQSERIRELEGAPERMREACRSIVGMASLMRKPCDEDDLDSFARLQEEMVAAIAALPLPQPLAAQEDVSALYHELLYQVGNKYDGETRHQTALRYIRQAEERIGGPAKDATPA